MEKYFLMENFDIRESEMFQSDEFNISEIGYRSNALYEISMFEEYIERIMIPDTEQEYLERISSLVFIGVVIMESDDYETLDLFRRLKGYNDS
jgi:hypothetical protein